MSREMGPVMRLLRAGRSAIFSRAPMRANLVSSTLVSMNGWTRKTAEGSRCRWKNLGGPRFSTHHLSKSAVEPRRFLARRQGRTFYCAHIHDDPVPGFGLRNVHREKWGVESLSQVDERGPIDWVLR